MLATLRTFLKNKLAGNPKSVTFFLAQVSLNGDGAAKIKPIKRMFLARSNDLDFCIGGISFYFHFDSLTTELINELTS